MKKYIFLAFVLLAPVLVFAAPTLTFNPVPSEAFNPEVDGTYLVIVDLAEYVEDTEVTFSISGPEAHDEATTEVIETYDFISSGQHEFGWDGNIGNLEGEPGVYEITISGEDLYGSEISSLTHTVSIVESDPGAEPEEDVDGMNGDEESSEGSEGEESGEDGEESGGPDELNEVEDTEDADKAGEVDELIDLEGEVVEVTDDTVVIEQPSGELVTVSKEDYEKRSSRSSRKVAVGQKVERGEVIKSGGATTIKTRSGTYSVPSNTPIATVSGKSVTLDSLEDGAEVVAVLDASGDILGLELLSEEIEKAYNTTLIIVIVLILLFLVFLTMYRRRGETTLGDISVSKEIDES